MDKEHSFRPNHSRNPLCQSKPRAWFILPGHGDSHTIKALYLDEVNESSKCNSYLFYLLQEGNEEWFVLGEDPAGVGPDITSHDEEISAKGSISSDTKVEQEKERVQQVCLMTK